MPTDKYLSNHFDSFRRATNVDITTETRSTVVQLNKKMSNSLKL